MNRFTGNVWLVKTYVKQVGQLRVLAAREASVEPTQDMSGVANMPSLATRQNFTCRDQAVMFVAESSEVICDGQLT